MSVASSYRNDKKIVFVRSGGVYQNASIEVGDETVTFKGNAAVSSGKNVVVNIGSTDIQLDGRTGDVNITGTMTAASFSGALVPSYTYTPVNTATYAILNSDYFIAVQYTSTGACTLTLPTAGTAGRTFTIFDEAKACSLTNTITIVPHGGETIMDTSSIVLYAAGSGVALVADGGTNWSIF